MTDWCISLHPQHWRAIVDGTKRYELRRRVPSIKSGDRIHVYVSRPVRTVAGSFIVGRIVRATSRDLWSLCQRYVPTTSRADFDAYFTGVPVGVAIEISRVSLTPPIAPWFHPPQGVIRLPMPKVDAPQQLRLVW